MGCSVIITSRNRAADLATTLAVLQNLQPGPDEIIVTLDGCTDDSAAMLAARFPAVRVIVNAPGRGSIPSRDQMLRTAQHELVLSLDDDSYPVERDFLAQVERCFARDANLAVAWFPQRSDEFPPSLTQPDFGANQLTGTYASSGAVLRRSFYLASGGYAVRFVHAYEEPDYALQCVAAGRRVEFCAQVTIRHHYSPRNRNEIRTHHLHSRNEQWSIVLRCPAPWWPLLCLRRAAGQFRYACRRGAGWVVREPRWWWQALAGFPGAWRQRQPVAWPSYRRWLHLLRQPEPLPRT